MKKIRKVQADLPSSASEGSMFYSRGSRKVRIFKGGSHIDYSAWEFILNDSVDKDGDGIADREDPDLTDGPAYKDSDGDGIPDLTDGDDTDGPLGDSDGDGTLNKDEDSDGDGIPDLTDGDDTDGPLGDSDGDGVLNKDDGDDTDGPLGDSDGDGTLNKDDGDNTDGPLGDSDGDGTLNKDDGDNTDGPLGDSDGDGVLNKDDAFPNDPDEQTDSDGDGIGDNEQAKIETFIHKHWDFFSNRYVASNWDGFEYDLKLKTSNAGHANIPITCVSTSSNERDTWGPNPEGEIYTGVYGSWSTPPMVSVGADSEITFSIDPIYSSIASIRDGRYFQATGVTGSFILVAHYPGDATHRSVTKSWSITAT